MPDGNRGLCSPVIDGKHSASDPPPSTGPLLSNRTKLAAGAGSAALVLVVFVAWFLFFRETAPPAVSLDDAVGSVTSTTTTGDTTTTITGAGSDGFFDGTWTIDSAVGGSVVEEGSFVGYRVKEELANIGAKTAVGRTTALAGTFEFNGTTLSGAEIVADLTQLTSDNGSRDRQMRTQAIETDTFPEAQFSLDSPADLGSVPVDGLTFSIEATGSLTIHGVTQAVTVPIEGQVIGETIVIVGRIEILFDDYGIDPPTAARVLSIEDQGEMEFQLFLTMS